MTRSTRRLTALLVATVLLIAGAAGAEARAKRKAAEFDIARVFFEYNLGQRSGRSRLPRRRRLAGARDRQPQGAHDLRGRGQGHRELGMTELFFEGAEPSLDDVPLQELLGRFPAGSYRLVGRTVDGRRIVGTARLTHAIPAGPGNVQAALDGSSLIISWDAVTGPPEGFPDEPIVIAGYQVIVGSFQVTVPSTTLSVTSTRVRGILAPASMFEVLAIEAGGNQTITEASFTKP